MSKWIAEFDLEDGDTMPEHMDLEYKGAKLDFHCRPKESILDKIRAELTEKRDILVKEARANAINPLSCYGLDYALLIIDKYKAESEDKE